MSHHSEILDLAPKPKAKKIKRQKNYRHGMRAQNPALLPSEDREVFDQILEGILAKYEPDCPISRHICEVMAMCIVRQRRIWIAEKAAAMKLSPPPPRPESPLPERPIGLDISLANLDEFVYPLGREIDSDDPAYLDYREELAEWEKAMAERRALSEAEFSAPSLDTILKYSAMNDSQLAKSIALLESWKWQRDAAQSGPRID